MPTVQELPEESALRKRSQGPSLIFGLTSEVEGQNFSLEVRIKGKSFSDDAAVSNE